MCVFRWCPSCWTVYAWTPQETVLTGGLWLSTHAQSAVTMTTSTAPSSSGSRTSAQINTHRLRLHNVHCYLQIRTHWCRPPSQETGFHLTDWTISCHSPFGFMVHGHSLCPSWLCALSLHNKVFTAPFLPLRLLSLTGIYSILRCLYLIFSQRTQFPCKPRSNMMEHLVQKSQKIGENVLHVSVVS